LEVGRDDLLEHHLVTVRKPRPLRIHRNHSPW
jgi:hypothetical protein